MLVEILIGIEKDRFFFKNRMISEIHLQNNVLPDKIIIDEKTTITIPAKYKVS